MDSVSKIGLQGMLNGLESASRDAARVTQSFSENAKEDPIAPLVDLQRDSLQVEASAKVIRVGNVIAGSILDLLG